MKIKEESLQDGRNEKLTCVQYNWSVRQYCVKALIIILTIIILQLTSSKKGLFVECLTLVWRVWLATVHLTTGLMLEPESCRPSMIRTRTWNSSTFILYSYTKLSGFVLVDVNHTDCMRICIDVFKVCIVCTHISVALSVITQCML